MTKQEQEDGNVYSQTKSTTTSLFCSNQLFGVYISKILLSSYQLNCAHGMSNIGFTSNLTSVFCRRVYLKGKCDCLFCHQIKEYYLCLSELEKACCSEQKFKSFKSLCKHFEQYHRIYTPYRKNPKEASKKLQKLYTTDTQVRKNFQKICLEKKRKKPYRTQKRTFGVP